MTTRSQTGSEPGAGPTLTGARSPTGPRLGPSGRARSGLVTKAPGFSHPHSCQRPQHSSTASSSFAFQTPRCCPSNVSRVARCPRGTNCPTWEPLFRSKQNQTALIKDQPLSRPGGPRPEAPRVHGRFCASAGPAGPAVNRRPLLAGRAGSRWASPRAPDAHTATEWDSGAFPAETWAFREEKFL